MRIHSFGVVVVVVVMLSWPVFLLMHFCISLNREQKKKARQDAIDEKKRAKLDADEEKRRERIDKRMAILGNQMNDRLMKEAASVREKSMMNFVRGLNKEFVRRRKAAELVVGNAVDKTSGAFVDPDESGAALGTFAEMIPPLGKRYDLEVVRIWDFLHSFADAFVGAASDEEEGDTGDGRLPSLDTIQETIDCLKNESATRKERDEAVNVMNRIGVLLCQVISPR